ncbi:MAG: T9SS type A sorting domain-containing protein [Lentimicrobium sp.]|nr:T9SS type A sorting domain-containing protein [Lentimicrobium sp.]
MLIRNNFLTLISLLFYLQSIYSQDTFLRIYPSAHEKSIYSIIETDDNYLFLCGSINLNQGNYNRTGTMSKLTSTGELVASRNYNYSGGNSNYAKIITASTTGFFYLLGSRDSVSNNQTISKVILQRIDDEMNTIDLLEFGPWPDYNNMAWDFEVIGDSIAYILSILVHQNTGAYNYLILRADLTSGNFEYYIPEDNIVKAASGFIIDEINNLLKVNYRIFNSSIYPWNPVAKISYDLSNIEVVMPDNEFFSQTKISIKNETAYLLSGAFIDDYTNQRDLGIAEYNLQDSLMKQVRLPGGIDTITYPGSGRKNILVTSDYIWVMGWYNCLASMSPCQNESTYIMLNKLTHDLELIEQIFYGGDGVYDPNDIIETSDHHIVVAGDFFNNLAVPFNCHFDPFILKVNNEGLIVNSQSHDLPVAQEAIVFPNPGHDYLQVKLAVQHKTATLELFDLNGRSVSFVEIKADMQQVNTSTLSAGIYPYRITANNQLIGVGKWVKE